MADPHVIYRETDTPEPVTADHPLEGLETEVLRVWMQDPTVTTAHQRNPSPVENAARRAVFDALAQEATLRAGLQSHEAEEFTRPTMWQPPVFPTT